MFCRWIVCLLVVGVGCATPVTVRKLDGDKVEESCGFWGQHGEWYDRPCGDLR